MKRLASDTLAPVHALCDIPVPSAALTVLAASSEEPPHKRQRTEKTHHQTAFGKQLAASLKGADKPGAMAQSLFASLPPAKLARRMSSTALQDTAASVALLSARRASFSAERPLQARSQPFDTSFYELFEAQTGKKSNIEQWGTLEKPRRKNGKSTIKFFEREGNVESGKPKINTSLFFLGDNNRALLEKISSIRAGGRPLVFGVNKAGRCVMAQEEVVPNINAKNEQGKPVEAVLGHGSLGEDRLRLSGEISMMKYAPEHALYDPENPGKKRLVLINKSGRFGREGLRTEAHLLNLERALRSAGVIVDEIIFRIKSGDRTIDRTLNSLVSGPVATEPVN